MKKQIVFCSLLAMALFSAPTITHARDYNAMTGRFMTMDTYEGHQEDPQSLHKYAYGEGDPVNNIDPSGHDIGDELAIMDISSSLGALNLPATSIAGASTISRLQPETLYVRAFAPWKTFGGGFGGDDRNFTTAHVPGGVSKSASGATSRITSIIKFQPMPFSIISETAYSDESNGPFGGKRTATPHVTATAVGNTMHMKMWGANPLTEPTADIDVKLDMQIENQTMMTHYTGNLYGDAFPDAEVFVVGNGERSTMLHTFTTSGGRLTGPFLYLPGDNNRPMGSFSKWVNN